MEGHAGARQLNRSDVAAVIGRERRSLQDSLMSDPITTRCGGGQMTAYRTVVVGTDGSESSLRAVERAAAIAADSNAKLILATGYVPHPDDLRAADTLGQEGYKVRGNAPIYAILHDARDRAKAAGAKDVEDRPVKDGPVQALVDLAEEVKADLLVVGNVGLDARSAIVGRLFSIPGAVANRAKIDVLIVRTTD